LVKTIAGKKGDFPAKIFQIYANVEIIKERITLSSIFPIRRTSHSIVIRNTLGNFASDALFWGDGWGEGENKIYSNQTFSETIRMGHPFFLLLIADSIFPYAVLQS